MSLNYGEILKYDIGDLVDAIKESKYEINIETENSCVYTEVCNININVENYSDDDLFEVVYGTNERNEKTRITSSSVQIPCSIAEGLNNVIVKIYKNNELQIEYSENVYRIEPYKKQFLDELAQVSVTTHYRTGKYEDYIKSGKLLSTLGVNYIRTDFFWGYIEINGEYNFAKYDTWINYLHENAPNIEILGILNTNVSMVGEDGLVNNEDELNGFVDFAVAVAEHYPEIESYQILNEPNGKYVTDENIYWYERLISETSSKLKEKNPNIKIIQYSLSGGEKDTDTYLSSATFYEKTFNDQTYLLSDAFAYNVYFNIERKLKNHETQFNSFGGFIKTAITEYGSSMFNKDDNQQVIDLIQQNCLLSEYGVNYRNIYNLWDTKDNSTEQTNNYGLLKNDYTPKKSYYAMKKYYENTNGSEYIGTVPDVQEGLELYIYDKDGTTLGICWSNSTTTVQYRDFVAYDLYGNEIPNTNGTLTITTTPVYLKNMSRLYFYKAIANNAVKNYDEFLTDYDKLLKASEEMLSVKTRIIEMKNTIADIANRTYVSESEAIELMEQHFNIGDMILDIYCRGKVYCKDVEVSSMLDKINTIGEAYEDLVTVAANNTSNARLSNIENNISEFSRKVAEKSDVDPIYPKKINTFAKDYYEIANYINELYEENPIKNGLIVSKGLHAYYLSNWANTFANNYFKESKVEISYSNTDVTNQDVTATVVSNVPIKMITPNMHTFYKNGSYTFRYIINDEEREIVATVDWIDKEKPVITGWENRVDELETVTIRVTDANLSKIVVTRDGVPYAFKNGDTLFEAGNYEIVAYDKVANSAKVTLRIVDYIESNKTYYISNYGSGNGLSESSPMNVQTAQNTRFYAGDKILFKSGQTYNLSLDWSMMGSPDDKIIISSYGTGNKPIINGYIGLVSNLDISNLEFTNMEESSLITRQNYTENVAIRKCTFNNIKLSGIYINRQVKNMEISDCIFKYCDNSGIIIKNDNEKLIASNVIIKNNMFLFGTDGIVLSGTNPKHKFEKVMISDNTFVNQIKTEGSAISIGAIEDSNFDVSVYNNLYYNFSKTYKVNEEYLGKFRDNFRADNNAFYTTSNSAFVNNIKDFGRMKDEYFIEFNSKNQTINESYLDQVNEIARSSISKSEILAYLTQSIIQTEEKKNDSQNELGKEQEIALPEGELTIIANRGFDEVRADKLISAADLPSKNSQEEIADVTVAQQALPLTGWRKVAITAIVILVVMIAFSGFKYGKYKIDTRRQIRK